MQNIALTPGSWEQTLIDAYPRRFDSYPAFLQAADHLYSGLDDANPCGYANISLFFPEPCADGTELTASFRFEGEAAPLIVLANAMEPDAAGRLRYGDYIEVVVWKNGMNVWQHWFDGGQPHWHKLCGLTYPVDGSDMQTLSVRRMGSRLLVRHGAVDLSLLVPALPDTLYYGIDACEGICRFYRLTLHEAE